MTSHVLCTLGKARHTYLQQKLVAIGQHLLTVLIALIGMVGTNVPYVSTDSRYSRQGKQLPEGLVIYHLTPDVWNATEKEENVSPFPATHATINDTHLSGR